jgi:hypothetical protein
MYCRMRTVEGGRECEVEHSEGGNEGGIEEVLSTISRVFGRDFQTDTGMTER